MKDIFILTAGSASFGIGHFRRSIVLQKEFEKNQINAAAINVCDFINKNENEMCDVIRLIEDQMIKHKIILVDLPMELYGYNIIIKLLKKNKIFKIGLDSPSDFLSLFDINILLWENKEISKDLRKGKVYIGLKYAIIRDDFYSAQRGPVIKYNKRILVSIGGADINSKTLDILNNLKSNKQYEFLIIKGPLVQWDNADFKSMNLSDNFKLFENPENYAELCMSVDLIICNGGNTLIENSYLGIPSIVIPQTSLEKRFSKIFEQKGSCIILNNQALLLNMINKLLVNKKLSMKMSNKGKQLIDGNGKKRIVDIIKQNI